MKYALCVAAALTLTASLALAASEPSPSSRQFLSTAVQGDVSEVELGKLAEQNGGSQGVRDFGKTLVADHSKAKDEAESTAKSIGLTPPEQPTPEAQKEYDKLKGLKGVEFDREFVRFMVEDHKKDIAKFKREARAKNGPTSALAERQLPVLEKHLRMADELQSKG